MNCCGSVEPFFLLDSKKSVKGFKERTCLLFFTRYQKGCKKDLKDAFGFKAFVFNYDSPVQKLPFSISNSGWSFNYAPSSHFYPFLFLKTVIDFADKRLKQISIEFLKVYFFKDIEMNAFSALSNNMRVFLMEFLGI